MHDRQKYFKVPQRYSKTVNCQAHEYKYLYIRHRQCWWLTAPCDRLAVTFLFNVIVLHMIRHQWSTVSSSLVRKQVVSETDKKTEHFNFITIVTSSVLFLQMRPRTCMKISTTKNNIQIENQTKTKKITHRWNKKQDKNSKPNKNWLALEKYRRETGLSSTSISACTLNCKCEFILAFQQTFCGKYYSTLSALLDSLHEVIGLLLWKVLWK